MKLTNETLRHFYLQDLSLPDIHHGRTTPKVKYVKVWKNIQSIYAGTPLDINQAIADGRKVWLWSDQHWGHKNIIKYTGRPFASFEEMGDAMTANYLATVGPDDIVFFGGDVAFMSVPKINELLDSLPGYKIHIVGNHDIHRDGTIYKLSVDEQHLCYALTIDDILLLITHYPMDNVPAGCQNVHGHIHQNLANDWNTNICVEYTNFAPRSLTDIVEDAKVRISKRG